MTSLPLRLLGVSALARLGGRMPGPTARATSVVAVVAANLLPILAVVQGSAGVGDVFALYWIENVVVGAVAAVRIVTAEGDAALGPTVTSSSIDVTRRGLLAAFFCLHYGLFTLVHGVFTLVIVVMSGGLTAGFWYWVVTVAAMVGSHLVALGIEWFGRDERARTSPAAAMVAPYPRMLVLHLAVILAFFFIVRPTEDTASVMPVAILCGLKTVVDVVMRLRGPWTPRLTVEQG